MGGTALKTRTAPPPAGRTIRVLRGERGLRLTIVAIVSIIWACVAPPSGAQAHAIVLESTPAQGSIGPAPRRLVLRFNSRLEKPLCTVELVGPRQRRVALLRPEAGVPPDTLAYPLPTLAPGEYQARWKVMAADGHVTEGTVLFTVAAS